MKIEIGGLYVNKKTEDVVYLEKISGDYCLLLTGKGDKMIPVKEVEKNYEKIDYAQAKGVEKRLLKEAEKKVQKATDLRELLDLNFDADGNMKTIEMSRILTERRYSH